MILAFRRVCGGLMMPGDQNHLTGKAGHRRPLFRQEGILSVIPALGMTVP